MGDKFDTFIKDFGEFWVIGKKYTYIYNLISRDLLLFVVNLSDVDANFFEVFRDLPTYLAKILIQRLINSLQITINIWK